MACRCRARRSHTPMPPRRESAAIPWKRKALFCSTPMRAYRANQREQEARAHAGSDVSDWQDEARGHALLVCLVRERQVSLCHADWQIAETLRGEEGTKRMCWIFLPNAYSSSLYPITAISADSSSQKTGLTRQTEETNRGAGMLTCLV